MSYIGNTPFTAAFLTDTFSGNGTTVAFTMSVAPANTSSILVAVTGVVQDPSTYSVSGTTLTFSAAPPSGTSNISVRYLGIPASGVTTTAYRTVTNFTATAGQTTFSTPSYTVGYIDVYRNGVRLAAADYTATNGTTVVLASAASAGDSVVTESFYVSSVLNAIPATASSVSTTYLQDASVTQAKLAAGVAGNGPAFSVWMSNGSANYAVSSNVDTVVPLDTKVYDTATAFNNTGSTVTLNGISVPAYSFAPNVAGYYQINILLRVVGTISAGPYAYINKNGSNFLRPIQLATASTNSNISGSGLVYLNGVSDYVTFAGNMSGTGLFFGFNGATSSCAMSGFLARAA